jgi:hypothetical protein
MIKEPPGPDVVARHVTELRLLNEHLTGTKNGVGDGVSSAIN